MHPDGQRPRDRPLRPRADRRARLGLLIRRALPGLAVLVALATGFWLVSRPAPLEFGSWPPEPVLRTVPRGPASAGYSFATIGLEAATPTAPPHDLCAALFDGSADGKIPVAFFTDHYCPNCRSLAQTLEGIDGIAVTRHELPILGPDSVVAARASLAAGLQGAAEAYNRRMQRAVFAPTPAYLRDIAGGLGIDADRFLADLQGPSVEAALQREAALANALGLAAVPVAIVGRTVVVGDLPKRTLARLVEAEHRDAPVCPLRR